MTGYSKQENLSYPVSPINMRSSNKGASHIVFSTKATTFIIVTTSLISLLLVILTFSACSLFDTRDPEDPTSSQSGEDIALTPEEVFSIFQTALSLRSPDLYLNIISNEFSYSASPDAYPGSEPIFDNWTFYNEDNFIRSLLSPALLPLDSTITLEFDQQDVPDFWPDSARYFESYSLEIHTTLEALPEVYGGTMDVVLRQEGDGGWRIYSWRDGATGTSPTFSQLRAQLY